MFATPQTITERVLNFITSARILRNHGTSDRGFDLFYLPLFPLSFPEFYFLLFPLSFSLSFPISLSLALVSFLSISQVGISAELHHVASRRHHLARPSDQPAATTSQGSARAPFHSISVFLNPNSLNSKFLGFTCLNCYLCWIRTDFWRL